MNNRQVNRRRGRSNNNRGPQNRGGGVDHQNRIDNRARGNATQMLEKYKKLASDAQLNGDRVQAEYYFQFADHYFRVQADVNARKEEQADKGRRPNNDSDEDRRQPRRNERDNRDDDYDNDDDNNNNHERDDRGERNDRNDRDDSSNRGDRDHDRNERPIRDNRGDDRNERSEREGRDSERKNDGERKSRPRRPRPSDDADTIDNAALPPAINSSEADEVPKPTRKPRARRPRNVETDEQADAAE